VGNTGAASLTIGHSTPADCFPLLESWFSATTTQTGYERVLDHGGCLAATFHPGIPRELEVSHHQQVAETKEGSPGTGNNSLHSKTTNQPEPPNVRADALSLHLNAFPSKKLCLTESQQCCLPDYSSSGRRPPPPTGSLNMRADAVSLHRNAYPPKRHWLAKSRQCCLLDYSFSGLRRPPPTAAEIDKATPETTATQHGSQEEQQELGKGLQATIQRFGHASDSNMFITSTHRRGLAPPRADSLASEPVHLAACDNRRPRHGSCERRHDYARDYCRQTGLARGSVRAWTRTRAYH